MFRRAAYTGTFDPITNGHIDIVLRSADLFDEVIVAVAENPGKNPMFNLEERIALIEEIFVGHEQIRVMGYSGLTANLMVKEGVNVMVRGIRMVADFEYEFQIATVNKELAPEVETIFLTPTPKNNALSSTIVRDVSSHGGDVSNFVHPAVNAALLEKFGRK